MWQQRGSVDLHREPEDAAQRVGPSNTQQPATWGIVESSVPCASVSDGRHNANDRPNDNNGDAAGERVG